MRVRGGDTPHGKPVVAAAEAGTHIAAIEGQGVRVVIIVGRTRPVITVGADSPQGAIGDEASVRKIIWCTTNFSTITSTT